MLSVPCSLDISPHERAAKEPQSGEKTSRKATLTRTCSQLREKKKIQETWISGTRVYCVTLQWNEVFHSLIHVWNAFWNIRDCLIAFWVFDELFCMKLGNKNWTQVFSEPLFKLVLTEYKLIGRLQLRWNFVWSMVHMLDSVQSSNVPWSKT